MLADIQRLAASDFNGRQTGTIDDLQSALWVADRFRELGLRPVVPDPLHAGVRQPWTQSGTIRIPTLPSAVTLALLLGTAVTPLRVGPDFLPILDSPSSDLTAPAVFVGYGLSEPAQGYDDYAQVDVANRVVIFMRGKPPWHEGLVSHETKVRWAQQHGAIGYLTVMGPLVTPYEARKGVGTAPLAYYGPSTEEAEAIPGAWLTVEAVDQLLAGATEPATLAHLQDEIHRLHHPRSHALSAEVRMQWDQRWASGTFHNVLGYLPGSDPDAHDRVIVVGAHRDHFGRQAGLLFPGADDNASGTAVMLEVARALAALTPPRRSVLFVSFSGEEQGLLGSKLYVAQPAFPLDHTLAMVNIDHAGIGNGRLTVGVTGVDKSLAQQAAAAAGLADHVDVFGFFPGGDHVPFKEANVPTMTVVSGGPHPHFHQPTDTIETIRPEILQAVATYVYTIVRQLEE